MVFVIFPDVLTALKQLTLEKEAELALTNNELAELEEYQVHPVIMFNSNIDTDYIFRGQYNTSL